MATKKRKPAKAPAKMGRPSLYTEAIGLQVCEYVSSGALTRTISSLPGMPSERTIDRWKADIPTFGAAYARARVRSAEVCEEAVVKLVSDVMSGMADPKNAAVAIAGSQWLAKVRDRATYGDKQVTEVVDGNAALSDDEFKAAAKAAAQKLLAAVEASHGGEGEG